MRLGRVSVAVPVAALALLAAVYTVDGSDSPPASAQVCPAPVPPLLGLAASLSEAGLSLRVDVLPGTLDLSVVVPPGGDLPPYLDPGDCPTAPATITEPASPPPPPPSPTAPGAEGAPVGPRSVT